MFGLRWKPNFGMSVLSTYQHIDGSWHVGYLAVWAHGGSGY